MLRDRAEQPAAAAAAQEGSHILKGNAQLSVLKPKGKRRIPPGIRPYPASLPLPTLASIATNSPTPCCAVSVSKSAADTCIVNAISNMDIHTVKSWALGSPTHTTTHARDLTQEITVVESHAIACGGCSNIYRGEWARWWVREDVGRTTAIALKILRTSKGKRDPAHIQERLNQEVRILLRLGHPNVVMLLGTAFVLGGERAMVLPWYKNGTVVTYTQDRPVGCRLCLIKEACAGVGYLHSLELPIVHGDLKGENILVDDNGHAVIIDFGLSNETPDLVHDTVGGSLRWLAPELLFDGDDGGDGGSHRGNPVPNVGVASDVWAFACTAYEILLGRLPYHNQQQDWAIIQEIMKGVGPVRPEDKVIHESAALLCLLQECWSLRPCMRPTITEVASRLDEVFF